MSVRTVPPVVREVEVRVDPGRAFMLFTAQIGRWWPLPTHSVTAERAVDVTMEAGVGGTIVEVDDAGRRHLWGTVVVWEPGVRVAFTWHPGRSAEEATEVEVRFLPTPGGTRVVLEHRGWHRRHDDDAVRERYDAGWIPVLAGLARLADPT